MPPVVIGAVIAMGAAAAGAIGVISMTTALVIAAVATAGGMLATKTPSFSSYASQQERKQVLRSSNAPVAAIYGKTQTSGLLFFAEEQSGEQDDGERIHLAITMAGHELDGIDAVYLGDEDISTYGEFAQWGLSNAATAADSYMLANCPSWKTDMIGRGIAWLRVTLKFNAEKFPSGIPNIKALVRGRRVYDPRDQLTKFTANAALVILDYYRNYLHVPDSKIIWEQFKTAANICDEQVTTAADTQENRYEINGVIDLTESPAKILDAMHEACAGSPTYTGGKHGIIVGAYCGPAIHEIHDHQLSGSVKIVPETAQRDRVNTITGTFIDPEQSYSETDFPSVSIAQWVSEDGMEISSDLDLRFVTSAYQAQRLANIKLRRSRAGATFTLPMNLSGFAYRPGEYIRLYIKSLGINGAEMRVIKWEFSLQNGVELTVREESAAIWDDAIGQPYTPPPLTTLPTGGPAAPDNLSYSTEVIGDVVQGMLSWVNRGSQIIYNQVVISRSGATVLTIQVPGQSCPIAGLPAGDYLAQVRAVAINGGHSPVAGLAFTISVPAIPVGVDIEAGNWSLTLRPKFATELSFGTLCEFWFAKANLPLNEVLSKAAKLGTAAYLVHNGLQPDTEYYYWIRAVNAYGKSALLAVTAKTSYDPASIIAVLDDQIGGELLRPELRAVIEQVPDLADGLTHLEDIVSGEGGISTVVDSLKVSNKALADTVLDFATTASERDQEYRTIIGTVTHEQQVQADNHQALAQTVNTVSATVDQNTSAIQQTAQAVTTVDGKMSALWATKAQINGSGGGFGLEVSMNNDGTTLTSFIMDVDVFAMVSRTIGASSKIHPFVVKNQTVYINHAMIDSAIINSLIANYITVNELTGVVVKASAILGTNFIGGSINIGAGKAIINSDGKATLQDADITGRIVANSGELRNMVIYESCDVKGTIYAEHIVGDILTERDFNVSSITGPSNGWVTALSFSVINQRPYMRRMRIYGSGLHCKVFAPPGGNTNEVSASVRVKYLDNVATEKQMLVRTTSGSGSSTDEDTYEINAIISIPANTNGVVSVEVNLGEPTITFESYAKFNGGIITMRMFRDSDEVG